MAKVEGHRGMRFQEQSLNRRESFQDVSGREPEDAGTTYKHRKPLLKGILIRYYNVCMMTGNSTL